MRSLLLLLAAIVCFIVGFLIAISFIFHSGNVEAWKLAGLALFAASFVFGPPVILTRT